MHNFWTVLEKNILLKCFIQLLAQLKPSPQVVLSMDQEETAYLLILWGKRCSRLPFKTPIFILTTMKTLRRIFFRGLITVLPIALTVYILSFGISVMENMLGNVLRVLLPTYIPGLGFILTLILIFVFGLLLNNIMLSGLLHNLEKWLTSIPLVKAVYSPLRDLMNLFSKDGQKDLKSVVLVDLQGQGIYSLGLVTRDSFEDLDSIKEFAQDKVAVYVPWSYGVGGMTFLVSKSRIVPVDIPTDKALNLAITGWIKTHAKDS